MTAIPCPLGAGHEALRHPDAMFCLRCSRRLPQRLSRAIGRASRGDEDPAAVYERCRAWLAGERQEPPRPKPVLHYTSTSGGRP